MFNQISKWFAQPSFSHEDQVRTAELLHTILTGLAIWMGLGLLINFLIGVANQANVIIGLVSIGLILMLRRTCQAGRVRLATLITSLFLLLLVTLAVYNLGTIRTILLGYYFTAFLIPTFLIGPRTGLLFAGLCILSTLGLMILEEAGMLPRIAPPTPSNQVIVFAEIVFILFVVLYLARRVMVNALERARSELIERKQAEEAARKSEEKYRKLIETTDTGFVIIDVDGKVLDANMGYVKLTGRHSLNDILGRSVMEWTAEQDVEKNIAAVKQCVEQGSVRNLEVSYVDAAGESTSVEINATLDQTLSGLQILSLCRDITERKRIDNELREHREHLEELVTERAAELKVAYEELKKLSHIKDEFVSNVSHELRTPIASLKVHQYLLKEKPEQITKYLGAMQRETDRLHRTIEALLQLSRLDQGHVEPKLVPINLNQLVEQYVQDRKPLAEEKGLNLTCSIEDNMPLVSADKELLGEAISILLTNAINYTPAPGLIHVSTQTRHKEGEIWVGIGVKDTGPGIPPDEQEHLFERFFRGRVSRQSGTPGTGLGLSLAREIIEKHNGTIECQNHEKPEQGATFSAWLAATVEQHDV